MTSLRAGAGRFEGIALFAASTTLPFGMAAIVGGLLSDNFGWRALFWIQAATIIPYIAAAARVLRQERGDLSALARVDWAHYLLRSEEHTSALQSLMRISYAVICLTTKNTQTHNLNSKTK